MVTIIPPRPEYNRFDIPESTRQDEKFENFVLSALLPPELYTLLESNNNLMMKDSNTGFEFRVQCRHRFSLISNSLTFANPSHPDQDITRQSFFFLLGLGGSPGSPEEVYLLNTQDCPHGYLLKRYLKNKAISINQPVPSALLWKNVTPLKYKRKKIA